MFVDVEDWEEEEVEEEVELPLSKLLALLLLIGREAGRLG